MTLEELAILVRFLRKKYHPRWEMTVKTQFFLGMRASEVLNIQIQDFSSDLTKITYRQAKTDSIITETLPIPLQRDLINYIENNSHTFTNGYIFPNKGQGRYKSRLYLAFFAKWRNQLGKKYKAFLESYRYLTLRWRILKQIEKGERDILQIAEVLRVKPKNALATLIKLKQLGYLKDSLYLTGKGITYLSKERYQERYRVTSHSLRRLHRDIIGMKIKDDYIAAKLCNYSKTSTYSNYRNEFKVISMKETIYKEIFNPVAIQLEFIAKGQKRLGEF